MYLSKEKILYEANTLKSLEREEESKESSSSSSEEEAEEDEPSESDTEKEAGNTLYRFCLFGNGGGSDSLQFISTCF